MLISYSLSSKVVFLLRIRRCATRQMTSTLLFQERVSGCHPCELSRRRTRGMNLRIISVLAAALLAALPVAAPADPAAATVHIKNFKFVPATLTVAPGTVVTFVNDDQEPHTVTATDQVVRFRRPRHQPKMGAHLREGRHVRVLLRDAPVHARHRERESAVP